MTEPAAEQPHRQPAFLESIIQYVPAGIAAFSVPDFRVLEANRFYQQFLDEPFRSGARPLVGCTLDEFTPQAEEAGVLALFRQVAASGQPLTLSEFEYHGFARGTTYWTWNLAPQHDATGRVRALIVLVVETTDVVLASRQLALALAESQERARALDAVIDQMVDGVVITDEQGKLVMINPAGNALLGRTAPLAPDAPYPPLPPMYTPDGQPYPPDELPLVRAGRGQVVIGAELVVQRPDRTPYILNVNAAPLRRADGQLSGALAVLRDVSEWKEAERLKNEFLSVVSHELRTPLSAILGYSDILLRGLHGPLTERQVRTQQGVRNNAQRLLQLIDDLLDVSKLQAGSITLACEALDLQAAVAQALDAHTRLTAAMSIGVANAVPAGLPAIAADPARFQQILAQLLSNALKFTAPGGRITISAQLSPQPGDAPPDATLLSPDTEPQSCEIMVQDTGIGLSEEQSSHIWDRFYQADSSSSRSYGGTGLGLTIVRQLMALHGGSCWATSPGLNKGTTIHLRLPLAAASLPNPPSPTAGVLPSL